MSLAGAQRTNQSDYCPWKKQLPQSTPKRYGAIEILDIDNQRMAHAGKDKMTR
jgi:hypothetical protein